MPHVNSWGFLSMKRVSKYAFVGFLACGLGLFSVSSFAGLNEGMEAYDQFDYRTAFDEWSPLATKGDARAQLYLATLYEYGSGVAQDFELARMWFRRAADQGNADAQHSLGLKYLAGRGVAEDKVEGGRLLRLAALNGNSDAAVKLAEISTAPNGQRNLVATNDACLACHAEGINGAPKIGDQRDWSIRLAHGIDTLYKTVTEGSVIIAKNCGVTAVPEASVRASIASMLRAVEQPVSR